MDGWKNNYNYCNSRVVQWKQKFHICYWLKESVFLKNTKKINFICYNTVPLNPWFEYFLFSGSALKYIFPYETKLEIFKKNQTFLKISDQKMGSKGGWNLIIIINKIYNKIKPINFKINLN